MQFDWEKSIKTDSKIIADLYEDNGDYLKAVSPPVFLTSLHTFDNIRGYLGVDDYEGNRYNYGRGANPTTEILEKKIAALEHGINAFAFSSGQAAFTAALLSVIKDGDHIICMKNVYGCVKVYLDSYATKKMKISVSYVDGDSIDEIKRCLTNRTSMIILESPTTFKMSVVDIEGIADLAKEYNITTYLDNTYCTSIWQKPLDLGIDISMQTTSKYIGGHSDIIGGILSVKSQELSEKIKHYREVGGAIQGPMEAWLALRGLRSLIPRLRQHSENARAVVKLLHRHDKVEEVFYPGLNSRVEAGIVDAQQGNNTGLLSFTLKTQDEKSIFAFFDELKHFKIGCSWGGYENLILLPLYNMPADELNLVGLPRLLIRLHCGLMEKEVIISDLEQALTKV